jgi:hypothetical protein
VRLETFESLANLRQRRTELLSRRQAHGYIEHRDCSATAEVAITA